jgi:hypothetical protein
MPDEGWDDLTIESFIDSLALMDTNNFPNKIGVGERESRIYRYFLNTYVLIFYLFYKII